MLVSIIIVVALVLFGIGAFIYFGEVKLLKRLVEIAFESATMEDFAHRVRFEYISGKFGKNLKRLKKRLLGIAKKNTNLMNYEMLKELLGD